MKIILKKTAYFILGLGLSCALHAAPKKIKKQKQARPSFLKPTHSAIVMNAESGQVLHTENADALNHPASLTKMMTLYMLFKELQAGKITMQTNMRISRHAANQEPTKLGLKAGSEITVLDAIQGIVTKSANDAAVVVGEYLSGNESQFAEQMTKQAHILGMPRTILKNASGLPNAQQVSSARDLAYLSQVLYKQFPQFFDYFSLKSFKYQGNNYRNHNRLLGKDGVDGFKTGFTNASGFNLAATALRVNEWNQPNRLIVVVLGSPTSRVRDQKVTALLETYFQKENQRNMYDQILGL